MAEEKQWLFWSDGMHIVCGLKQCATKGYIGIDAEGIVMMFNNRGELIDQAPVQETEGKFSIWTGDSIKLHDKKYRFEFKPLSVALGAGMFGALGAVVSNAMVGSKEDKRSPKERRQQFKAVFDQFHG